MKRYILLTLAALAGVGWLTACKNIPAGTQHEVNHGVVEGVKAIGAAIPGFGLIITSGATLLGNLVDFWIDKATAGQPQPPATGGIQ